jgi:signal peptidase I
MTKKRNPFLAALATFGAWGLGQLYNGKPIKAAVAYASGLAYVAFAIFAPLSSSLSWLLAAVFLQLMLIVIFIIDAVRDARNSKEFVLRRYNRWWIYLGIILIQVLLVYPLVEIPVHSSIKSFHFPTGSMEPTIKIGDRFIANMKAYNKTSPARGDLAVFKYPENNSVLYVKRVIGLPGEKIEMVKQTVFVNDQPLKEPYAQYIEPEIMEDHYGPFFLPKDKYFMLGDNRDNSHDSRFWGYVDRSEFVGQVRYLYWAENKSRIGKQLK